MKKKNNKSSKQKKPTIALLLVYVKKLIKMVRAHGIFIMFLIAGGAIGFALLRSQAYLNPPRDEAKYQELSAGVSYSKIDYTLVNKLQAALKDTDVTVTQNLAPNRNNPFSE